MNLLKIMSRNESLNKSFENCVTKRIHEMNVLKTRGFANPNPKDSVGFVYPIVLKIREDSLDSSNLLKIASQNKSMIQVFENLGNKSKRNKSSCRICFVEPETNLFGVRIRDYDTKRIHVFTNLLYDSRILTYLPTIAAGFVAISNVNIE
jgi:hypothetical protein